VVEGRIKVVKSLLRAQLAANPDSQWDELISFTQHAINSTVSVYNYSPEEIFFGDVIAKPTDPLLISAAATTPEEYIAVVKRNLATIHANVAEARARAREQNELFLNSRSKERRFTPGQLVFCHSTIIAGQSGLIARKRGPYIVEEISTHGQTAHLREISTGKCVKRHFMHMVPMEEARMSPKLNSDWDRELREFQDLANLRRRPLPPGFLSNNPAAAAAANPAAAQSQQ
jgi:hypothetical protein